MKKVAIIDSGSGGVNVLFKCILRCPCFNFLLYIDDKNLPYGEKSETEIRNIAGKIIKDIDSFFCPDIFVIACNTMTAVSINFLRKKFPNKVFIGSEPAILPALREFDREEVVVLATDVTIKKSRVLQGFQDICFCPKGLPKFIDDNLLSRDVVAENIKSFLPSRYVKAMVLGCTHFEGIKKEISRVVPKVKFFESSEGIAKRLACFMDDSKGWIVQFLTSKGTDPSKFWAYFNLLQAGQI